MSAKIIPFPIERSKKKIEEPLMISEDEYAKLIREFIEEERARKPFGSGWADDWTMFKKMPLGATPWYE